MSWVWSWALSITSGGAFLAIARKKRWGWLIGISSEILWTAYSIVTKQWGFLASVGLFTAVYAHGWWHWRPESCDQ